MKPCPCGKEPEKLFIQNTSSKYMFACGSCCGNWYIEFRTNYETDWNRLEALAVAEWNSTPRTILL